MIRAFALGLLALPSAASAYDIDFATYGGHSYAFVNEWLTWEQADAVCASGGAHLAVVDDLPELAFLLRTIHGGPRYNDSNDSWVGATLVGPYAGDYAAGLIFTWPSDRTVDTAFWYRPSEFARHKAICELF